MNIEPARKPKPFLSWLIDASMIAACTLAAIAIMGAALINARVEAQVARDWSATPLPDPRPNDDPNADWLPSPDARPVGHYYVASDGRSRSARYVLEFLTPSSLIAYVDRADSFRSDPTEPPEARATTADYVGTGFDRGHLAAAANHLQSEYYQSATYLLTNVIPQDPTLNRGLWRELEHYVRAMAAVNATSIVITAPLYLPDDSGQFTVRTIGTNRVWIPTHLGKAILAQSPTGEFALRCWILPNTAPPRDAQLADYRVTGDTFESAIGLDCWKPLPDDTEQRLESR